MTLKPVKGGGGDSEEIKAEPTASILYVEDEDLNWRITERHLRHAYALTRARNAREAFAHLAAKPFELILMDIQLAGSDLDGIQITRILKGTYLARLPSYVVPVPNADKIPIVFVTAYGSRYPRNTLMLAGAADVIHKPVSFASLNACLARLTEREARKKQ